MMMLNATSSVRFPQQLQPQPQQPQPPSCAICRTVGASQHYGVLTCSACMNFFRRTVTENLKYHCLDGGSCIVAGAENRTKCRQCRWALCLQMGMKPECIGGPQQHHLSLSSSASSSSSISPQQQQQHQQQHQQRPNQRRSSAFREFAPLQPPPPPPLQVHLPISSQSKQQQSLPTRPQRLDRNRYQSDPLYSDPYLYHLSSIDIRTLRPASSHSSSSLSAAATSASARFHVDTWLGLIDAFVAELIRWCKDLSGFCNLRSADQSALIRANGTKLMCLQVLCNSLPYQGRLRICSGVNLRQFDSGFCSRRLFKRLVAVCQFATDIGLNYSELLLLRPIFLLDPPGHLQWAGLNQVRELQSGFLSQLARICPSQARREQMLMLNRELTECWRLILEHLEALLSPGNSI